MLNDELRRKAVQAYYASISFMDSQVGRVVNALDRLGLADSTVIVFTSDHGFHLGEHGLWKKHTLFEEAARVPLIIAAPGAARGRVAGSPVSHVDLYPTLADLAGVKAPANLQGQSLVPLLKDPNAAGRGWAFTEVVRGGGGDADGGGGGNRKNAAASDNEGGRKKKKAVVADDGGARGRYFGFSLRTARWRYTEWGEGGRLGRELYDHDSDPKELTNLAGSPEHARTVRDLASQLAAAAKQTYPASGTIPERRDTLWSPVLVK